MARMSTTKRNSLRKSQFAGPGRSFPINDRAHAEAAIRLAPRSEHAGNISRSTERKIVARAKRKLGKRGGGRRSGR